MNSSLSRVPEASEGPSAQAEALARRLENGARALIELATGLSEAQWQTRLPHDVRKFGVVIHHVGSMYPLEIQVAQKIAAGEPIVGATAATIDAINAAHAEEYDGVTKEEAIELVRRNSEAAAAAIRAFSDEELARAVPISLYEDAPLTAQFFLEDHAVRHSYHHLGILRAVLSSPR